MMMMMMMMIMLCGMQTANCLFRAVLTSVQSECVLQVLNNLCGAIMIWSLMTMWLAAHVMSSVCTYTIGAAAVVRTNGDLLLKCNCTAATQRAIHY
jgi:uncharacterized protein YerC